MNANGIVVGDTLLFEGRAWTVKAVGGSTGRLVRAETESGQTMYCEADDLLALSPKLFGVPGRIEAAKPSAHAITAMPATANAK